MPKISVKSALAPRALWASFRRQRAGQFPLARLYQHLAQLPHALGVIGQRHTVVGLLQLEFKLANGGVGLPALRTFLSFRCH